MKKPLAEERYDFLWRLMADVGLSPSAKCAATVLSLLYRNSRTGLCNPSYASLARAMGSTRRNAINAVRELATGQWIAVESTLGGSQKNTNKIAFNFERGEEIDTGADFSPVNNTTRRGEQNHPRTTEEPLSSYGRESVGGAAIQRAPDGALICLFEELFALWSIKPHGVDRLAAKKAFLEVCKQAKPEDVLASAHRWVSAISNPRYLPALEVWLGNGAWRNDPPIKASHGKGRGGKASLAEAAMNYGRSA